MKKKKISIVVPCFNEEETILEFNDRLSRVLENLDKKYDFETIFINDGSTDKTQEYIDLLSYKNNNIKFISLSRNFGHQIAVSAGIDHSTGNAVIIIDADLQDPPEIIPKFIDKWENGCMVAYGVRTSRKGETKFKLITAKIFYIFLNYLSNIKIPLDTGDFRLIDKKVVDIIKNMPEKDRFLRGMVSWVGFKQEPVKYNRDERFAGKTKYPLFKMFKFALDGIISFSVRPLQFATLFGVFIASLSFIGIVYSLYNRLFSDNWVPGWSLLFISTLFIGGIQLIFLGLIGEYVGRSYGEAKNRPLYIIDKKKISKM